MNFEEAKQEIHERGHELLTPAKVISGTQTYICPLCENGTGKDGDGLAPVPNKQGYYHCFKCDFHGDLVQLVQDSEHVINREAFARVYARLGITITGGSTMTTPSTHKIPQQAPQPSTPTDFTNQYDKWIPDFWANQKAIDYMHSRGLSDETLRNAWIGFDGQNIIIPTNTTCYLKRGLGTQYKGNGTGSILAPYNIAALDSGEPVYVVEGEIDALSVMQVGGQAVGLGSTSNVGKLIEIITAHKNTPHLIISLDNDDAGKRATQTLADALKALDKSYSIINVSGHCNDPNDALMQDPKGFTDFISKVNLWAKKPDAMTHYADQFDKDVLLFNQGANRKTGYKYLDDQIGGLYTGFYVIGAISSLGKTTFIHQMADQLAEQGENVLFFSLEQSKMELYSKSLARTMYDPSNPNQQPTLTGISIRSGKTDPALDQAKKYYLANVADNISVIESNFNCTVDSIHEKIRQYKQSNPYTSPVVIIDYLQILQPPESASRATTKEITDMNTTMLKRISRDENVVIIAVSSVNRANYSAPISFESFKESGAIEYTADVIWGLQLSAITQLHGETETVKREKILEAKKEMPRKIQLVCLKNRFGITAYTQDFLYAPQYDTFVNYSVLSASNTPPQQTLPDGTMPTDTP